MFGLFNKKDNTAALDESAADSELAAQLKAKVERRRQMRKKLGPKADREIAASAARKSIFSFLRPKSVSGKELAVFTRQLAATINAGLLLTEALETIGDEAENSFFQDTITAVRRDIQSGHDFSSALARHPKVFPDEYVSIIKAGEAGGGLAKTLTNLAKYLEKSEQMKAKIKSAVRYPLFVLGFAMVVVLVMVLFLIPKFKDLFDQAGAELPLLTRVVVSISDFTLHNFHWILLGLTVLLIVHIYSLRLRKYRVAMDAIALRLPIIGKEIIHKSVVSRFCHTLGFLLGRGVGLSQSLQITAQAVNNLVLFDSIEAIRAKILSGAAISQQLKTQKLFPPLVSKMASVGEKTGSISTMLEKTGEYYDDELEISIANLMVMIEPVLIVFVGSVVCVVIIALYLPIFNIGSTVR